MSRSDYLENKDLDHVYGGPDYVRPATVYLALSTTTPNDAGGSFTEPVGNGYARVAIANNATNFPAAVSGVKSIGTEVAFVQANAFWGIITHFGVYDAPSGGNLMDVGALGTAKSVGNLDTPKFEPGALSFTQN